MGGKTKFVLRDSTTTTLCSISIVTTGVEKMQERRGTDIRLIGIRELSVLHILHFGSKLNNYRALTRKPFYDVVQGLLMNLYRIFPTDII